METIFKIEASASAVNVRENPNELPEITEALLRYLLYRPDMFNDIVARIHGKQYPKGDIAIMKGGIDA